MEKIIYRKTLDVHKNGIQFTLQGFETADKLSRRIEINLVASGDTYELPLEGVAALMYITTPDAEEPSIEECTIKDNTIVYDVLPIVAEGITEMQLKLIGTNYDGAEAVLISPRFAVEVLESEAQDESAEQTTLYTALENAVAKASAIHKARLLRIEVDENCIFKAYYANGISYESSAIRDRIVAVSTDADIEALVKDAVEDLAIDDVINQFSERKLLGTAIESKNLANEYKVPTFVKWDDDTANTPHKAGLTEISNGFAMCFGDALTQHTAVVWTKSGEAFVRKTIGGVTEWTSCLTNKGGTVNGNLNIVKEDQKPEITFEDKSGILVGKVSRDEQGTMLVEAADVNGATNGIKVTTSADVNEGLAYSHTADGETKDYKLYGEHNVPHPAQIYSNTYEGAGEGKEANDITITAPFKPHVVYLASHVAVRPSKYAYRSVPNLITECDVIWGETDNTITFKRRSGSVFDSGTKFNDKGKVYSYIIIGY